MEIFKRKNIKHKFDRELYQAEPLYITTEAFWEGGIQANTSLTEKAAFYSLAEKMSAIIKEILQVYGGKAYLGKPFCECGCVYVRWSDAKKHQIFRTITGLIDKSRCYEISLPEDDSVIDLIVESNFRYFSYISLYIPKVNMIIQPTCHTEVLVYSSKDEDIIETLKRLTQKHSSEECLITVK